MRRSTYPGAFLLVEGGTDARLLDRLIDKTACAIKDCFNRDSVLKVVGLLDGKGFTGHLAIVDDDHGQLLGEKIPSANVVVTEKNDLEVVVFESDAFERLLAEYANADKVSAVEGAAGTTLREALYLAARDIGTLRYLSKKHGWNVKFSEMTYRFVEKSFSINRARQIEHLRGRHAECRLPPIAEVEAHIEAVHAEITDCSKLVSGHDLCEVIARGLHQVFGRAHIGIQSCGKAVEEVLRTAYTRTNFATAKLFADIAAWEKVNPGFKVL